MIDSSVSCLREPRQLMTLAVRNDQEQEEDSGLEEDEQPTEYQHPTKTQIKMVNQYHRNLGHPSRREFLKVLKAAHAKPAVLEYVRREYVVQNVTHTRNHSLLEWLQSHALTNLIASLPWTCSTFHCADNLSRFEHHLSWHEFPDCSSHATRRDSHSCHGMVNFSAVMAALFWHARRHDH